MKPHRSVMSLALTLALSLFAVLLTSNVLAQQADVATPAAGSNAVPRLVNFSGVLKDGDGHPLAQTSGVTFLFYKDEQGGAPLWLETQNVTPDKTGRYSVQLGASSKDGLPADVFASGEARWLAVQPAGQAEQARVILVAVPYAMKAADAETIGGLPPSAFVRSKDSDSLNHTGDSPKATTKGVKTASPFGTANYLPVWTSANIIQNSNLFQSAGGNLGIGTASPAATLDVHGTGNFTGLITFASGQTFPGAGTITGVTTGSGSGLTGGGTSGTLNLSLTNTCANKQVLQWNGSSWGCANLSGSGTVTSVGLSAPSSDFTVTGSPITTAGTLGLNWTVAPTSANTANAIVKRDASGSFNAGIINASTNSTTSAVTASSSSSSLGAVAIHGFDTNTASTFTVAVQGNSSSQIGAGVLGMKASFSSTGQSSIGNVSPGVWGDSPTDTGVYGTSDVLWGVYGLSNYVGVGGTSFTGVGVEGSSRDSIGVEGFTHEGNALWGYNQATAGATDTNSTLLLINNSPTSHYVIYAEDILGAHYVRTSSVGDLAATGSLVGASKNFKIDHPVDPTNKYLMHTSIESPDMKNMYDGVATLDENGEARVELPGYFEALNKDFRYQLTSIGAPGPNLYVAEEVSANHFGIAGGKPGAKVSWQVTGIRHDAWANANRSPVEVEKTARERGLYLHPEAFGEPVEKSVTYRNPAAGKQFLEIPQKHSQKVPVKQSAKQ